MQALIVHDDRGEARRFGRALLRRGFMVASAVSQEQAMAFVRQGTTDLLILKQVIGGRHTTSVALAGEHYNARTATILLSDRPRQSAIEQFELIPTLQAILSSDADATLVANLALQAVRNPSENVLVLSPQNRTGLSAVA